MEKLKIAIDLDGTIYPWHELVLEHLIEIGKFGKDATLYDVFTKDFWQDSKNAVLISNILNAEIFYDKTNVFTGVLAGLQALDKMDVELWYVTKRPLSCEFVSRQWLKRNKIPQHKNFRIIESGSKEDVFSELGITICLDDRWDLISLLKDKFECWLIRRPWNMEYAYDKEVFSVMGFVREIEKKLGIVGG